MTTESQPRLKITYATLRADNEQLHAEFEAGLTEAKTLLAGHHRNFVAGSERDGDGEFTVRSPIDRDIILGHFATGTRQDVRDAGVPDGVINLVMGPGETVGAELRENPGIDGIVFTGSYDVGMDLFRTFSARYPKPTIVEMGGKNPAVVSRHADLDEAAEGIMRSSFGFGGQKCSANSRVYVEKPVHDELVRLLVQKTEAITIGDPLLRENWLGPVIDQKAVDRHQAASAEARRDGRVLTGGEVLSDRGLDRGFYVEPTVVDLPADHRLFRDELFAPFTAVAAVDTFDEAIRLANDSVYGLTAGVYSDDEAEVQRFLDTAQAGVLYVNRRAGATTGAWPGVQAFGGWKGSGSTGKSGLSMYYVAQFLREQSHTVVD